MPLTVKDVEELAATLRNIPPEDRATQRVTALEAVRMMRKEITELQRRGYSTKRIAELLNERGLSITPTTLKNYLRKMQSTKKTAQPDPIKIKPTITNTGFVPAPDTDEI